MGRPCHSASQSIAQPSHPTFNLGEALFVALILHAIRPTKVIFGQKAWVVSFFNPQNNGFLLSRAHTTAIGLPCCRCMLNRTDCDPFADYITDHRGLSPSHLPWLFASRGYKWVLFTLMLIKIIFRRVLIVHLLTGAAWFIDLTLNTS